MSILQDEILIQAITLDQKTLRNALIGGARKKNLKRSPNLIQNQTNSNDSPEKIIKLNFDSDSSNL